MSHMSHVTYLIFSEGIETKKFVVLVVIPRHVLLTRPWCAVSTDNKSSELPHL